MEHAQTSRREDRPEGQEVASGRLPDPTTSAGGFVPFVWDPVHGIAAEFLRLSWAPIHERGAEALAVVMQLSGDKVRVRDEELAALYFTLVKGIAGAVPMSEERRNVFLQDLGSAIYVCHGLRSFCDPERFWDFLNQRNGEYLASIRKARETKPLITAIDHFLCYFGLGGSENIDVVFGLYRFLSPLLAESSKLLRDRAAETMGARSAF